MKPNYYVSTTLSEEEAIEILSDGGFDDTTKDDDIAVHGYLPDEDNENPTFAVTVNDENTGYEIDWLELPTAVREYFSSRK